MAWIRSQEGDVLVDTRLVMITKEGTTCGDERVGTRPYPPGLCKIV